MSDWLYPLSSKSDYYFVDEEGNRIWCEDGGGNRFSDTGFDCFKEEIRSGSTDVEWILSTNYRNVRKGDRVWIYYGTADSDIEQGTPHPPGWSFDSHCVAVFCHA